VLLLLLLLLLQLPPPLKVKVPESYLQPSHSE
jgi:hypothetical protein